MPRRKKVSVETSRMGSDSSKMDDGTSGTSAESSRISTTNASVTCHNEGATASSTNPIICVKNVLTAGKIDQQMEKQNKEILTVFLERLLPVMKEKDDDFAKLFQKLYYTGSYYENLRISDPNEFDINLILKLPFKEQDRDIEFVKGVKSFVKYKLKTENNSALSDNNALLKKLFEGEYLMPFKVRSWMQGIVDRAVKCITLPPHVKKLIPSASGPAKTMLLETDFGYRIDIDLVPVIQFSHPYWPKCARKDMLNTFNVKDEDKFWFLVPKDFANDGMNVNPIDSKRLWRIHFPEIEKKILHDRGQVKPLIKLLKALRNNENWQILASYYLKTIVLWLVEKNPDPDYWKEGNIYTRLLEALEALKECVRQKFIRYYFYPDFNLIQKIGSSEAEKISNRLERIIRIIKMEPEKIEMFFKL